MSWHCKRIIDKQPRIFDWPIGAQGQPYVTSQAIGSSLGKSLSLGSTFRIKETITNNPPFSHEHWAGLNIARTARKLPQPYLGGDSSSAAPPSDSGSGGLQETSAALNNSFSMGDSHYSSRRSSWSRWGSRDLRPRPNSTDSGNITGDGGRARSTHLCDGYGAADVFLLLILLLHPDGDKRRAALEAHTAVRPPRGARRQNGSVRRLLHAATVRKPERQ